MSETKEIIKVDITNYERFWEMLNSPDTENHTVALSILDQAEFRESLPFILLLLKEKDNNTKTTWLNNAPNLKTKLASLNITDTNNLSYKYIIDTVKDKCPTKAVQFVIDKFSITLKKYLIEWGFDFVKGLELKLILPDGQ